LDIPGVAAFVVEKIIDLVPGDISEVRGEEVIGIVEAGVIRGTGGDEGIVLDAPALIDAVANAVTLGDIGELDGGKAGLIADDGEGEDVGGQRAMQRRGPEGGGQGDGGEGEECRADEMFHTCNFPDSVAREGGWMDFLPSRAWECGL
jgi:hypothetical protein